MLTLPKRRFRLGEDITGVFRFLQPTEETAEVPSCIKVVEPACRGLSRVCWLLFTVVAACRDSVCGN